MEVYILESHDDWHESHYIVDVFATREAAIAYLMEYNDNLVYDERYERYEHSDPDSTRRFIISVYTVRN
jgi:hypothetical protein